MVKHEKTAQEAMELLIEGNKRYVEAKADIGDVSAAQREKTLKEGQYPYAIIITCSDSRVIPESIFSAGIGDLFVISVAGNVIDNHQLGSVEYAAEHLGSPLVVVLGHSNCGAVDAAMNHEAEGYIKYITDEIAYAIGDERDYYKACCLNAIHSKAVIEESLQIPEDGEHGLKVVAAMYHLDSGKVEFLD